MTTEATKSSHGGARPGAGRKPSGRGPITTSSFSLSEALIEDLDRYKEGHGLPSRSVALETVARRGLERAPRRPRGQPKSRAEASVCVPHLANALRLVAREVGPDVSLYYTIGPQGPAIVVVRPGGKAIQIPGIQLDGLDHYAQAIRDCLASQQGAVPIDIKPGRSARHARRA